MVKKSNDIQYQSILEWLALAGMTVKGHSGS